MVRKTGYRCTDVCVCIYIYVYTYIHIYIYIHTDRYRYAYTHVCIHMCMYITCVCIYIYIFVCINMYTNMCSRLHHLQSLLHKSQQNQGVDSELVGRALRWVCLFQWWPGVLSQTCMRSCCMASKIIVNLWYSAFFAAYGYFLCGGVHGHGGPAIIQFFEEGISKKNPPER